MPQLYTQHHIYHDEAEALAAAALVECEDGETVHVLTNPKTGASWIIEVREADGSHMMFL